jgi:hypothetical protein
MFGWGRGGELSADETYDTRVEPKIGGEKYARPEPLAVLAWALLKQIVYSVNSAATR